MRVWLRLSSTNSAPRHAVCMLDWVDVLCQLLMRDCTSNNTLMWRLGWYAHNNNLNPSRLLYYAKCINNIAHSFPRACVVTLYAGVLSSVVEPFISIYVRCVILHFANPQWLFSIPHICDSSRIANAHCEWIILSLNQLPTINIGTAILQEQHWCFVYRYIEIKVQSQTVKLAS